MLWGHIDEARRVPGDANKIIRAYRLYLSGSDMRFGQVWTLLSQILASRSCGVRNFVRKPRVAWLLRKANIRFAPTCMRKVASARPCTVP